MEEEWRDVTEYEGIYQVSNLGRVKRILSNKRKHGKEVPIERILKQSLLGGYLVIGLHWGKRHKHVKAHRLVAEAFLPNDNNFPEVNHLDCNKCNNIVDNLEWTTNLLNKRHAVENNLTCHGERQGQSVLTESEVIEIRELARTGRYVQGEIADMFGVSKSAIQHIVVAYTWKYLGDTRINMSHKRKTHRKPTCVTFEQACEIRDIYATGRYTQAGIAKMLGFKDSHIYRVVRNKVWRTDEYQELLDSGKIDTTGSTAKFTNDDIKEMKRLRSEDKLSYAEIGRRFSVTHHTISKLIRVGYKLGIKGETYDEYGYTWETVK